jgi:hypothetical protein
MNQPFECNVRQEAGYVPGMMDLYVHDRPFFEAHLYGIGQSVYGTIRFFNYSKKIRNIS